jgi:hypothetical protein
LGYAQINRALGRIIANPDIASAEYILEFLNSDLGKAQLIRYSQGGMQRRFNHPDGEYISVPILDNEEDLLDALENARNFIGQVIEQANKYKVQRFALADDLDSIFVKDHCHTKAANGSKWMISKDPLCKLHTENRNSAIVPSSEEMDRLDSRFYLPCRLREVVAVNKESWGILSDYAEISRESYVSDGELRHIAIDQMPDDPWTPFKTNDGYEGPTTYLEEGDIAFSRLMPTIMNGKCFLAWDTVTGSPEFIRVRTSKKYQKALLFWLKTRYVREYLLANVRGSSASQKRFTEDDIAACPVPKALFEDPQSFIEKCDHSLNKANEAANKAAELNELANLLTNKIRSNIFALLDSTFLPEIERTVKEALQ